MKKPLLTFLTLFLMIGGVASAKTIELNCYRNYNNLSKIFEKSNYKFTIVEESDLVLEYWSDTKITYKYQIYINQDNFIEAKAEINKDTAYVKIFLKEKKAIVSYMPSGSIYNYSCR
jgi:hypothetical protein